MSSHEELREALGAYALDQLDPDEALRIEVEQHLQSCELCRIDLAEIAPLAHGLRAVDPAAVRPVEIAVPTGLDDRIRAALPAGGPFRRTRGWVAAAGGLAVGAVAASALAWALPNQVEAPMPVVIAVPGVTSSAGVTATAGVVDHTWGVEVKLEATGLPAGETFQMWVVGDDGTAYEAGEFIGVKNKKIICDMSSSVLLDDAASFRVVNAAGDDVISGKLPS